METCLWLIITLHQWFITHLPGWLALAMPAEVGVITAADDTVLLGTDGVVKANAPPELGNGAKTVEPRDSLPVERKQ